MMRAVFPLIIALLAGCSPRERSWVALGDSITYLNEHPDETGNRITAGYMTRVVRKLPHIHYTQSLRAALE